MGATGWNVGLDTGHPALDEQHQELARLHAAAVEGARGGDARATRTALQALLERTREHFAFEERLMTDSGYASREAHAGAHAMFLKDLVSLLAEASREACSPLVRLWLESRCDAWWKMHVRSSDAGLASHVLAAAARQAPVTGAAES